MGLRRIINRFERIGDVVILSLRAKTRTTYPTLDVTADFKILSRGGTLKAQLPAGNIEVADTGADTFSNPSATSAIPFQGTNGYYYLMFKYTNTSSDMVILEAELNSSNLGEFDGDNYVITLTKKTDIEGDLRGITNRLSELESNVIDTQTTVEDNETLLNSLSTRIGSLDSQHGAMSARVIAIKGVVDSILEIENDNSESA